MERTLLLVPSGSFYYFNSMKLPNVVVFPVFREVHGASEMVWKAMRKLRLAASSLFYTDWYKDLQSFSKIIVFDFTVWLDQALLRNILTRNVIYIPGILFATSRLSLVILRRAGSMVSHIIRMTKMTASNMDSASTPSCMTRTCVSRNVL